VNMQVVRNFGSDRTHVQDIASTYRAHAFGVDYTAPSAGYTPRWVFDAMRLSFDLDVAAPVGGPRHVPAMRYYTPDDDGLSQPWDGLVWCNPPYSHFRPCTRLAF
jgi:hypothetical protein